MLEMVIFAITFVVAQTVASFIIMKLFMTKAFLKKIVKTYAELANEVIEEIDLD
jgi:hypothetical protein